MQVQKLGFHLSPLYEIKKENFLTSYFACKWLAAYYHSNQHLTQNPKNTCSWSFLEYQLYVPDFFNILKEPLLVQKQIIFQKKALILSFWEPARQRYGNIKRVPCLLAAKSKGGHGAKKVFFMASKHGTPCSSGSKKLGIFFGVLFISVLAVVLSESWRRMDSGNDCHTL